MKGIILLFVVVCLTGCNELDKQGTIPIHAVECVYEYDEVRTFHIPIPLEVKDIEAYSEGFCNSIK